jgi:CotH kinase protein/Lamin Tail Domain/Secretion system C-terminal sorting domain
MFYLHQKNLNRLRLFVTYCIISLTVVFSVSAQDFYDINSINSIEIVFEEQNWDQILDDFYAAGDEERLIASAIINGVEYDSVGVRYKGNSSYSPNRLKNPINIKLDHIIADQNIDGYGTVKLANVYKDPTFIRETLSYEIARQYMPASQANYANLYINSDLYGLYTSVQSVDKVFLGDQFGNNDNSFFKGELVGNGGPQAVTIWGYFGPDSSSYTDYFELRSDSGWTDLIDFLDVFNNTPAEMENYLDVDGLLWMISYDLLMINLDAPVNFGHNYYLYENEAGLFNPILWDLNENFGGFSMLLSNSGPGPTPPLSLQDMQQLDPLLNSTNPEYPIISQVLQDPDYQKIYYAHLRTMIEENFSNGWYESRALELQEIVDEDVQADPNKFYTYNDFINNIDNSAGSVGPNQVVGITELMEGRISYLNSLPELSADPPVITDVASSPEVVSSGSEAWIIAEVTNVSSVKLAFRNSISEPFQKIEMLDDGLNSDGSADDGVYGILIPNTMSDVQYYIYAENNDAAMFSPLRAAYEFYTLNITHDIVINEFMSDNGSVASDQDGEYDDWIELYNNTTSSISLVGYYLSDDSSDPTKWAFPDTVIAANEYLIIWADNDIEQVGLHAGFKLSASGEVVLLVNPDEVIINEIEFDTQPENISTGRYPNGTGEFQLMDPTFSEENVSTLNVSGENSSIPESFLLHQNYPNPFNPTTTISFDLVDPGLVQLSVFDMLGREIAVLLNRQMTTGSHRLNFSGSELASGIYFYKLSVGNSTQVRKMVLVK